MDIRRRAWPVVTLAAFTAAMLYPQLVRMDAVPDLGDPLFSIWRMGWVYRQLLGDPRGLFDANIFYPEALTFAYSDSMLLPALAGAPLLLLGLHPVVVYNVLLVSSFYLSALAAFLLVRDLTGSRPAAFVSALVFGFYPFRFEHYSHLELQMTFWMPLALLCLHRFAATAKWRWGLGAAVLGVAQLYSSMYMALFFACYVPFVAVALVVRHRERLAALLPRAIVAGCVALLLAVPLGRVYAMNREVARGRSAAEVAHFSAERMDFARAQRRSVTWAHRTPPGRMVERALFPGAMPVVLAGLGLLSPAGAAMKIGYGGALLFSYEGALGSNGVVFPWLGRLPAFGSIRVPARFSALVGLSLAVLSGFGVCRMLRESPPARTAMTTSLLALAIFLDFRSTLELRSVWPHPPGIYDALPDDAVLAELPARGEAGQFSAMPHMYFSFWHGRPMVNGYSGYWPESYEAVSDALDHLAAPASLDRIRERGATHVTVNCALFRAAGYPDRCARVLASLDALPGLRRVTRVRWSGDDVVVYHIADPAAVAMKDPARLDMPVVLP